MTSITLPLTYEEISEIIDTLLLRMDAECAPLEVKLMPYAPNVEQCTELEVL